MMRLTAYVSGKVQEVGYRARVVDIAIAFGLKGMVENLKDGRAKIIAEGEDEKLKWFASAIDIKNTLIHVSSIEKQYSPASNEFDSFGKLVAKGETDAMLDTAAGYLKELVFEVKNLNNNLSSKMDQMLDKQDELLDEVRDINGKFDRALENDIVELKNDMAEVKAAPREKGII
ncbi:MAG: Acylphosphatase [Methanosaeta sp. PtaU1.Bin112]|nr:MAG: Acylphosphatase [Methanosaeta sp. PtaU1.Bin112]